MGYTRAATFVGLLTFAVLAPRAWAQDCGQILQSGIWETRSVQQSIEQDESFLHWACSNQSASRRRSGTVPGFFQGEEQRSSARNACSRTQQGFRLSQGTRSRCVRRLNRSWNRGAAA
jgi:hypothetical protein